MDADGFCRVLRIYCLLTKEIDVSERTYTQAEVDKLVAEARRGTLKVAAETICSFCSEQIPHENDKTHKGGGHCYAWAIFAALRSPAKDAAE